MYLTIDYLLKQIPSEVINLTSADDTENPDFETISQIINEVQNEIDNVIETSDYNVSEINANPPAVLRRIALKFAKYYLYQRKTSDKAVLDPLLLDVGDARAELNKILEGKLNLYGFEKNTNKVNNFVQVVSEYDKTRLLPIQETINGNI